MDFDKIPYGNDNKPNGIYRVKHGDEYFVHINPVFFEGEKTRWTFLTTESLVSELLNKVYQIKNKRLVQVHLEQVPGVLPVSVPIERETRASARKLSVLVRELLGKGWRVIADGASDAGAMSFQRRAE